MPTISGKFFPHMHLCLSQVFDPLARTFETYKFLYRCNFLSKFLSQRFEPYNFWAWLRSPIAILSCWFDSFNLQLLHGMTFNHWEQNLASNELNLSTSVGSSRKIKSTTLLSKFGSVQFFWISFSRSISISWSVFQPPFKRAHQHRFHPHAPNQKFCWKHFFLILKSG